jgi:hypothetical protein
MNEGSSSSASPSTGTTHANAAPNTKPTNAETEKLGEAEFLQQKAREAQQAISRIVGVIGKDLGHSVDPRAWTKSHPWASLATAAAGGFALVMLFPSEEKRALRRLEKIQRAVAPKLRIDPEDLVDGKPAKPGLMGKLIHETFATARPIILSAISAALAGGREPTPQAPQGVDIPPAADPTAAQSGIPSDPDGRQVS